MVVIKLFLRVSLLFINFVNIGLKYERTITFIISVSNCDVYLPHFSLYLHNVENNNSLKLVSTRSTTFTWCKNFKQIEVNGLKYNDSTFGKGMHTIKTKSLVKTKRDITKVLPQEIIQTYGKIKFV